MSKMKATLDDSQDASYSYSGEPPSCDGRWAVEQAIILCGDIDPEGMEYEEDIASYFKLLRSCTEEILKILKSI